MLMHPSRGDDVDVARPVRRWRAQGKPQRTELFLRWSAYLAGVFQPILVVGALSGSAGRAVPPVARALIMVAAVASTVVYVVSCRVALASYLGRRPRPTGWLIASALVMLGSFWSVLATAPDGSSSPVPSSVTATAWLAVFWFGPLAVALPVRACVPIGVLALLLSAPAAVIGGLPAGTTAGLLVGTAVSMAVIGATWRSTAWIISVVWELDAAREAQSRLAVAEERLRFSRDLHDVLGRNLTTIALKSELAVRLARGGRAEAADQMVEVQRIAQESQREVREVVRGYRTADLAAEVAGARAVLRAAGVTCEIDLGPDAAALPPLAQSVLGWVVREAATNVLRHSEAASCAVRLRVSGGTALLEVENDGVGERGGAAAAPGTGLVGLRERLAAHGGRLTVPPASGGRFRLAASLPLDLPALEVAAP
ncbi:sensor histidine kinase [Kitasatospora sp. NPDC059571]|uniref:sensor histidine kinase n=1 Tax=Kitasatospora sp. NPDC059571 TaxID=3346871 RepID=UPI0036C8AE1C